MSGAHLLETRSYVTAGHRVIRTTAAMIETAVQASWHAAAGCSATASAACVPTWHTDFREDLARIDVPALVMHGDADRIVPISASGARTAKLIKGARFVAV